MTQPRRLYVWRSGLFLLLAQAGLLGQNSNLFQIVTTSSRVSATAAGGSFAPAFSADGRSVVFFSFANNLVTNDNRQPWLDLFVQKLETGENSLQSPANDGSGGGDGNIENFSPSADASRIVFSTYANDQSVVTNTNSRLKVLVRDVLRNAIVPASVTYSNEFVETWRVRPPAISRDGRFVLFQSTVAGLETNGYANWGGGNFLYVGDLQSNVIHLASQSTNLSGAANRYSVTPSLSADGRLVAFVGYPMVPSPSPDRRTIYVRDLVACTTTCISTQIARIWPEWESPSNRFHSYQPKLTPDGRCVIFTTRCYGGELWHYDRLADAISLVATNLPVNTDTETPKPTVLVSDDGNIVVYENGTNIFAWDARNSSSQIVDLTPDGITPGNGIATHPALSADGMKIIFISNSSNLAQSAGLPNGSYQIYLRDLSLGVTHLVSTNAHGQFNSDYSACCPVLSPDGTLATFDSTDDSLVENDFNHDSDVFVKNLLTGELRLISRAVSGLPSATALGSVYSPSLSLSRDGRFLAFTATDGDLVAGDTNVFRDAFVSDQQTGSKILASVGTDGSPGNLDVLDARVSDDGRFVLFSSLSANLFSHEPPQVLPGINYLYLRDLSSNITLLVASNDTFSAPTLSPDGRYVAFAIRGTNLLDYMVLSNGARNVYLYDTQSATNILVSRHPTLSDGGNGNSSNPRFSPDGQWLVFDSVASGLDANQTNAGPSYLYLYNLASHSNRLVTTSFFINNAFDTAFSSNSRLLAYADPRGISVLDVILNTNLLSLNDGGRKPALSTDGSLLAYYKSDVLNIAGIYIRNMTNQQKTRVIEGISDFVLLHYPPLQITDDGRYLLRMTREGTVPADTNGVSDVYLYDVRQSNMVMLTSPAPCASGNNGSMLPMLSPDGRTLVFHSFASDFAANDFNGGGDWVTTQITPGLVESIARPTIIRHPSGQTNFDGTMAALSVTVASGANVFYQWWKEGVSLTNNGRLAGANAATLIFNPLLAGDSGGYSVVVSNVYGSQTSLVAMLTVVHPPFALQDLTLTNGVGGKQVTFGMQSQPARTYQLLARPDLTLGTWLPEGLPISATGEVLWFSLDLGTNTQRYFQIQQAP